MDLGLTLLQAKIYLALSKTGKATIKTISKASNIARQDAYRIMPALQKLGLAEKIIAEPTMYKATPLKEGVSILLQNKTHEHSELQKKTIVLIKSYQESNDNTTLQEEEPQFVVTSSKTLLFKRLAEKDNTAQTSIDIVGKWEGIRATLFYRLQDFKRALKRGVRIRIITEKHEDDKAIQKNIQTLTMNPLFGIRYLSAPIPLKTAIIDGTEMNMCIAIPPDNDVPSLWSDNPQFVKVMVAYFEELWNKTLDVSETLPRKNVKLSHRKSEAPNPRQNKPKVQPI
jgi:sugar-specific transcriptional regulator TrmB